MSDSNILRLLRDALTLNGEKLDLASGDVLKVRPNTDDTGSINIGDGTYDMDVKVFLGSTSEYILFDVGNSRIQLEGVSLIGGNRAIHSMPAPETAVNTATLTDAQMLSGLLVGTPTAAAAYTMRTGTELDAALTAAGIPLAVDEAIDLAIINLGATTCTITLTASTDITIVGDPVIGAVADIATTQQPQGIFRLRKTAANTFVAYRIA